MTEGYIGVTSRLPKQRFVEHSIRKTNKHLQNAFKKYKDDIIFTIILESDDNTCLLLEEQLRSNDDIGWNIVKGGGKPPLTKGRKLNLSPEERDARSKRTTGVNNPMFGKHAPPKSPEAILKYSITQKTLAEQGLHPFQTSFFRQSISQRQQTAAANGTHPLQSEKYRKEQSIRKITQNKIFNSTEFICPNCGKVGKGPNMKRYHFDKCKHQSKSLFV